MFQQQFTIGHGSLERCHTLSLPSIKSMQELKAGIAKIFSVSDSDCEILESGPGDCVTSGG